MGPPDIVLKWQHYSDNLMQLSDFSRNDRVFTDVTLAAGMEKIEAHRLILASASTRLNHILNNFPHPHPLVYLSGIQFEDIVSLLDFMYHGQVRLPQARLSNFLSAAEELGIKGLSDSSDTSISSGNNSEEAEDIAEAPLPSAVTEISQGTGGDKNQEGGEGEQEGEIEEEAEGEGDGEEGLVEGDGEEGLVEGVGDGEGEVDSRQSREQEDVRVSSTDSDGSVSSVHSTDASNDSNCEVESQNSRNLSASPMVQIPMDVIEMANITNTATDKDLPEFSGQESEEDNANSRSWDDNSLVTGDDPDEACRDNIDSQDVQLVPRNPQKRKLRSTDSGMEKKRNTRTNFSRTRRKKSRISLGKEIESRLSSKMPANNIDNDESDGEVGDRLDSPMVQIPLDVMEIANNSPVIPPHAEFLSGTVLDAEPSGRTVSSRRVKNLRNIHSKDDGGVVEKANTASHTSKPRSLRGELTEQEKEQEWQKWKNNTRVAGLVNVLLVLKKKLGLWHCTVCKFSEPRKKDVWIHIVHKHILKKIDLEN